MAKYMYMFVGGKAPQENAEQDWQDWADYMAKLGQSGKMLDGAPFDASGRQVVGESREVVDYVSTEDSAGGYAIMNFDSMEEAEEMAMECPSLKWGGRVEIRPMMQMTEDGKGMEPAQA